MNFKGKYFALRPASKSPMDYGKSAPAQSNRNASLHHPKRGEKLRHSVGEGGQARPHLLPLYTDARHGRRIGLDARP